MIVHNFALSCNWWRSVSLIRFLYKNLVIIYTIILKKDSPLGFLSVFKIPPVLLYVGSSSDDLYLGGGVRFLTIASTLSSAEKPQV